MKKYLIGLIVLLLCLTGCASTSFDINSVEPYQEVIEVADTSADLLFVRANQWAVGAFNNADSVIEFSDKESGIITGKYIESFVTNAFFGYQTKATTMMNIEVKDSKLRVTLTLTNIETLLHNGRPSGYSVSENDINTVKETWNKLVKNLKSQIISESSNW